MAGATADDVKKDPRASARAKYAKHSADALKIVEPVKITRVFYFKDGGTAGIELTDAKDMKHPFCLYPPGGAGLPQKDKQPKIIPNLFIGATHPTQAGAKMVALGGPEESALYGVLLRVIDKHKEKDAILTKEIDQNLWDTRKLWGADLFETHAFFHRLEGHFLKE
jgi:hypothetical protein